MVAERNKPREVIEKVVALLKAWRDIEEKDAEARLRDYGYDPNALAEKGATFMKETLHRQRQADLESLRRERIAAQARAQTLAEDVPERQEDADAAIREILAGRYGQPYQQYAQTYFRNFQEASPEDKKRLLNDLRLLKKLAEKDEEAK